MQTFKHGDRAIINGRRFTFGTISGYAEQYNENPAAALERERGLKAKQPYRYSPFWWVHPEATVLCSDRGYYEREREKFAGAPELQTNDVVIVIDSEGPHRVQLVPAANRNIELRELTLVEPRFHFVWTDAGEGAEERNPTFHHYLPGDVVTRSVAAPGVGKLTYRIELLDERGAWGYLQQSTVRVQTRGDVR